MDTQETEQVLPTLQLDMVNKAKREKKNNPNSKIYFGKTNRTRKKTPLPQILQLWQSELYFENTKIPHLWIQLLKPMLFQGQNQTKPKYTNN